MTDVELKNRGNKLFAARKYEEAITCYSDAIVSDAGMTWKVANLGDEL